MKEEKDYTSYVMRMNLRGNLQSIFVSKLNLI